MFSSVEHEMYKWLDDWVHSCNSYLIPSKELQEKMKVYRPNKPVILYRAQSILRPPNKILLSYTYSFDVALRFKSFKENKFPTEIITKMIFPEDILIDFTRTYYDYKIIEPLSEVIVINRKELLQNMQKRKINVR